MSEDEYYPDVDALYEERTEVINDWYDSIDAVIDTYYKDESDEDSCCV